MVCAMLSGHQRDGSADPGQQHGPLHQELLHVLGAEQWAVVQVRNEISKLRSRQVTLSLPHSTRQGSYVRGHSATRPYKYKSTSNIWHLKKENRHVSSQTYHQFTCTPNIFLLLLILQSLLYPHHHCPDAHPSITLVHLTIIVLMPILQSHCVSVCPQTSLGPGWILWPG
jgi:hypothetical protein